MTVVRQTIAVIITFRKSDKNSLERRVGAFRSSRKRNTLYKTEIIIVNFSCTIESSLPQAPWELLVHRHRVTSQKNIAFSEKFKSFITATSKLSH